MNLPFCEQCQSARTSGQLTIPLERTVKGELIQLDIDTDLCTWCDANPKKLTRELRRLFNDAYRAKHDLVTTGEIKQTRQEFGLNQRDFARLIGLGEITVARYESGFIPSKANSLRIRQLNDLDRLKAYYKDTKDALSKRAVEKIERYIQTFVSIENGNRVYENERFFLLTALFVELANEKRIPMYVTKLNKYMFYADFLSFKRFATSITGSRYVRLSFGPVPNRYDYKYDMNPYIETRVEDDAILYYRTPRKLDLQPFTSHERSVIEEVFTLLHGMRSSEVSEMSHKEAAWVNTEPGEYVSYLHAKDLRIA